MLKSIIYLVLQQSGHLRRVTFFNQYLRYYYRIDIYFSGQGNMTSEPHIFKQLHQEFEQGQIPSNTQTPNPFALMGSANNGDGIGLHRYSNHRNISLASQTTRFSQEPYRGQPKNLEWERGQKKTDAPFLTASENMSNQSTRMYEQSGNNWKNSNRSYQTHGINAYNSHRFAPDNFNPTNSYNLNKNFPYAPQSNSEYIRNQKWQEQAYGAPNFQYPNYEQNQNMYYHNSMGYAKHDFIPQNYSGMRDEAEIRHYESYGRPNYNKNERDRKLIQEKMELQATKKSIKESVAKHRIYFRTSDWQRLLFIIQEIILENNNGIKHLWDFINKFEDTKKFRKGNRVFEILKDLSMDWVFDKLIEEEQRYKKNQKQKQTNFKVLLFNLVHKIQ